ncbi:hypothetical protein ACVW0K_006426 [Streptomyces filamentosus]
MPSPPSPPASPDARVLVTINAWVLAVGVVLSCSTSLGEISLYGRLTLGMGWALAQLVVLVGGTWWYENRAASSGEPEPAANAASHAVGDTW